MSVWEPYEEPDDPYGLNEHFPEDRFSLAMGLIPIAGLGAVLAAFQWSVHRPDNRFNMANAARKEAITGAVVQSLYVTVALVVIVS